MKIIMKVAVSGSRDGERWPGKGEQVDLPPDEAADLIAAGLASRPGEGETATAVPRGEQRARSPQPKTAKPKR